MDYTKAIRESKSRLLQLRDAQKLSLYYRRLQFLYLLQSGVCQNQQAAGATISLQKRGAQKLWNLYRQQGLRGLLDHGNKRGRKAKLNEQHKVALKAELHADKIQTLRQACDFIAAKQGIVMSPVAMHYYFKAMGIKKKTGRSCSVRKDQQGEQAFKKSLSLPKAALWQ